MHHPWKNLLAGKEGQRSRPIPCRLHAPFQHLTNSEATSNHFPVLRLAAKKVHFLLPAQLTTRTLGARLFLLERRGQGDPLFFILESLHITLRVHPPATINRK